MKHNTIIVDALTGEVTYTYSHETEQLIYTPTEEEMQQFYKDRVVQLIRERYDINSELDVQRNRDTEVDKFQEYFDYVEQCKIIAQQEFITS